MAPESGLGILRDPEVHGFRGPAQGSRFKLPPEVREFFLASRQPADRITKATVRSRRSTAPRPSGLPSASSCSTTRDGQISVSSALRRPVHVRRLFTGRPSGHPAPSAEDRHGVHGAFRLFARAATTARPWRISSRPIRATSCSRSSRTSSADIATRHPAPSGASAAHRPLRPLRRLQALRLLPGLRAARSVLDRPAQCAANCDPACRAPSTATVTRPSTRSSRTTRSWPACT